jgi:hypothetical protein
MQNLVHNVGFRVNANLFAENWQKSQKTVIIFSSFEDRRESHVAAGPSVRLGLNCDHNIDPGSLLIYQHGALHVHFAADVCHDLRLRDERNGRAAVKAFGGTREKRQKTEKHFRRHFRFSFFSPKNVQMQLSVVANVARI